MEKGLAVAAAVAGLRLLAMAWILETELSIWRVGYCGSSQLLVVVFVVGVGRRASGCAIINRCPRRAPDRSNGTEDGSYHCGAVKNPTRLGRRHVLVDNHSVTAMAYSSAMGRGQLYDVKQQPVGCI